MYNKHYDVQIVGKALPMYNTGKNYSNQILEINFVYY